MLVSSNQFGFETRVLEGPYTPTTDVSAEDVEKMSIMKILNRHGEPYERPLGDMQDRIVGNLTVVHFTLLCADVRAYPIN